MADNFNDPFAQNLIGLWDFLSGNPKGDTGLADGIAQNGTLEGGASVSGGRLHLDNDDGGREYFDVDGDHGGPKESAFDLAEGTISVQFTQDEHIGKSHDTLVNRGEYADRDHEGWFAIQVTKDGEVKVLHHANGKSVLLRTTEDFFDEGDNVKATYAWSETEGLTFTVENLTTGTSETITSATTGLTMDIGDNDDEIFTFGARESDDGRYDQYFDGTIDYVAVYDTDILNSVPEDGAVDGEDFGEVMGLGYDDSNAPTDQGGDKITDGDDLIFGNGGDDTIFGAGGDDTIYGDSGDDFGVLGRESFNWDGASDSQIDHGFSQNTGSVTVTYDRIKDTGNHESSLGDADLNVTGIDTGGESIDDESGLFSLTGGKGNEGDFEWVFSDPVGRVAFNVNDIDGDGIVRILAFDADGNPVDVDLAGGSNLTVTGNVADSNGGYADADSDAYNLQVTIPGPVSRVVVEHDQNGPNNSGIFVTDIYFDVLDPGVAEGGDDVIIGGAGADDMYGEGGDDTFVVSSAADGNGDVIVGGNGPDELTDNDVLDLRGAGPVTISDAPDATDAGARAGTVTFADGSSLQFSQIETILTDPVEEPPVANDDTATVAEDETVIIDVLGNDTDPNGDDLTVTEATSPDGEVTINPDGTLTFAPDEDFNGDTTISYTITDGNGGFDSATVDVTVTPVNDDPVANDDVATTAFQTSVIVDVLGNDTDVDGDTLRVTEATSAHGVVTINADGTLTFTPADGFEGDAVIDYTVTDDNGGFDSAQVAVTVEAQPLDGIVSGTDDGELIDADYLGDPQGDRVDNGDNIFSDDPLKQDDDIIEAGGGDDTIVAGEGDDLVFAGTGDDRVHGGPGNDTLFGEDGDDTIFGGAGDDSIEGGDGHDTIFGGDGSDTIFGGDGDDLIYASDPDNDLKIDKGYPGLFTGEEGTPEAENERDFVDGGAGNDTIFGGDDRDTIFGGTGDDVIDGGIDDDEIHGGEGDDRIVGGEGSDLIYGGDGNDTIYAGNDPVLGLDALNIEDDGSNPFGPDLRPDNGRDTVYGGAGDDLIYGADDDDVLLGGAGNDTIFGEIDDDYIDGGIGDDSLMGGQGNDTIEGGDGNDFIDGGLNADTLNGGAGDDTILGGNGADVIDGGAGDDVIDGGTGDDTLNGGPGDDLIMGASGHDVINGGTGDDTIDGGTGDDTLNGGPGDDLIKGGGGDDVIGGGAGDDTIDGGNGDDTLDGGDGDDLIKGGAGDDVIDGGAGNDTINGGPGDDIMFGGDDRDTFINVNAGDVVDGGEGGDDFDTLDLRGSTTGGGSLNIVYDALNPENGVVNYFDSNGDAAGTLAFSNIENVIPCFTPGTRIATASGERRVEDLKVGDRVITRDNGIQAIRWIGKRLMTGEELAAAEHLRPVLIRQGALGKGLPERDMLVSPQHRVLMSSDKTALYFDESEVLVAAKHLTDMDGIDVVEVSETTYVHVMFDQHEVILSDGAWTESFQPGDQTLSAMGDAQRGEILDLFPELGTLVGIEAYAAARRSLKKHEARLLTQ